MILPLLGYILYYFNNLFALTSHLIESYGDNVSGIKFWFFLPVNALRLFIGPFPWTNWFNFDDNSIFLIADYFQTVMNITLVILLLKVLFRKKYILKVKSIFSVLRPVDLLFLTLFSLFILAGLGTKEVHLVYMSTGIIFLIPTVTSLYQNKSFTLIFIKVFCFFILFNILFIFLGFGGEGLGNSFR